MVFTLRVAVALVVVASRATEDGINPHVGGSFTGMGERLQVKVTVPAKVPDRLAVIIEEPD